VPVVHVHEGVTQEQHEESIRRLAGRSRWSRPPIGPFKSLYLAIRLVSRGRAGFLISGRDRESTQSGSARFESTPATAWFPDGPSGHVQRRHGRTPSPGLRPASGLSGLSLDHGQIV
jgi:hypothetical protein